MNVIHTMPPPLNFPIMVYRAGMAIVHCVIPPAPPPSMEPDPGDAGGSESKQYLEPYLLAKKETDEKTLEWLAQATHTTVHMARPGHTRHGRCGRGCVSRYGRVDLEVGLPYMDLEVGTLP